MSENRKETLMVGYHKYEYKREGITITMDRIKEERGDVIGDMTNFDVNDKQIINGVAMAR